MPQVSPDPYDPVPTFWERNSERVAPWLGNGLGMGTNVGAGLATGRRAMA